MPRKHLIASGINKKQQAQAKMWMKCAKEIKAAAKIGGPNPEANPRLKTAIARALQNNLSRESIEKNINGANKDASSLKEIYYEAYGPNGMAILIKVLTDNEQRSVSAIRGYLSKLNGQLAKPNSVKMIFDELGEFILDKQKTNEEEILNCTIDFQLENFIEEEDSFLMYCKPNLFFAITEEIEKNNIPIFSAEIKYVANRYVSINDEYKEKYERFINSCDDDDDIQWVVTNCDNA